MASRAACACAASTCVDPLGRPARDDLGEPQVQREGNEVLLGAVVDVALQPAAFGVLGLDHPSAGAFQLAGTRPQLPVPVLELRPQPDQSQHETGLRGQPDEQALLHAGQGDARPLLQPELGQHLVAVPDRQAARPVRRRPRARAAPPVASDRPSCRTLEPDLRPLRARPLGEQARHATREVLGPVVTVRSPTPPANRVRTSYGVSRRSRIRSSRLCTGANASATTVVASTDSAGLGESVRPTSAPPPSTTRT